jgi:uncharacterized protein YggU (UPF0235/DUF167 family)
VGGERPWTVTPAGIVLAVRVTPKGGSDAVAGIARLADGRLVLGVRVRAAPSEGAANTALVRLVADALGVPARAVTVLTGRSSRIKRLAIAGDGARLAATLEKICAAR